MAITERILTVIMAIPYVLGWLMGTTQRAAMWALAATVAGYKAGRGR